MEKLNYLAWNPNIKIYQNDDYFMSSLDSILLANYVEVPKSNSKTLEIGAGIGTVSVLIAFKHRVKIDAVELQKELVSLLNKNVEINGLKSEIKVINENILIYYKNFREYYDVIVCNPPYFPITKNSKCNLNDIKTNARHETTLKLEDLLITIKYMLKNKGVFYMVYPTERIQLLMNLLTVNNLYCKEMKFIFPKKTKKSEIVLLKIVKQGKMNLRVDKPFIVHNNDGSYSDDCEKEFKI